MQADRSSAARRAPWRARVSARLRAERGDTLVEVVIGALMVALIATASLGGFADIGHLGQTQRSEAQAAALAQQDQARLRGLTIAQLSANGTGTGNTSTTQQVNGTVYTITSNSQFISGSTGTAACTGGAADEVQTTSTVTWGSGNNAGRRPVIVHGVITPNIGGAIVASIDILAGMVSGSTNQGATGATITLTGPTAVTPVTVDSSGCAVFSGLASGSYTVKYTMPPGTWAYYPSGSSTVPNQSVAVTNTRASTAPTQYIAQPGAVQATFKTTYNGSTVASGSDTFQLANPQLATLVVGTDSTSSVNTFVASLTSPATVFPFDPGEPNNYQYSAYAGGCSANAPTGANAPATFTVAPGATTSVQIPEPPLVIQAYTKPATTNTVTYDDDDVPFVYSTGINSWSTETVTGDYGNNTGDHYSNSSGRTVTINLPANTTSVALLATTSLDSGKANISINGGASQSVDFYSSSTVHQAQFTFDSSDGLNGGSGQTLVVSVTGTKSHNFGMGLGTYIRIDGIIVTTTTYGASALMTTKPTVTLTDSGCSSNKDWPPTVANPSLNPTWGALQYPGVPWTSGTYSVCVDDGTNHYTQNWTPSWAGTTALNQISAYIYTGAPAPPSGAGYGTGTCP